MLLVSTQTLSSAWCTLTHLLWLLETTTQRIALNQIWTLCLRGYTSPQPRTRVNSANELWAWNTKGLPPCLKVRLVRSCHLCSRVSCGPRLKWDQTVICALGYLWDHIPAWHFAHALFCFLDFLSSESIFVMTHLNKDPYLRFCSEEPNLRKLMSMCSGKQILKMRMLELDHSGWMAMRNQSLVPVFV